MAAAFLASGIALMGACAKASESGLSETDFKDLARTALSEQQRRLPGLGFEIDTHSDPRYVYVTITWQQRGEGSVIVDNLAIDNRTVDVWSATSSCSEKSNSALTTLQLHLRKRLKISPDSYRRLKNHGPLCDE